MNTYSSTLANCLTAAILFHTIFGLLKSSQIIQSDLFFQPKICWKAVGRNLAFAIVDSGVFLTAPASFISAGKHNEFILAILCSKLGKYYIYQNSDTTGAGDIMLNIQSLIRFPIPQSQKESLLIQQLVNSSNEEPSYIVLQKIDRLIYDMYKFSPSEIEIIESV